MTRAAHALSCSWSTVAFFSTSRRQLLISTVVGVAFALPLRIVFALPDRGAPWGDVLAGVMSSAFLFGVPTATGAVVVWSLDRHGPITWKRALIAPWLACAATMLGAMLTFLEGSICVAMAAPVFLAMSSLGGLAMWGGRRWLRRRQGDPAALSVAAALPLVMGLVEPHVGAGTAEFQVENVRVIAAPADAVWREIASVPAIDPAELPESLAHRIGLPRPIEATLSDQRLGGVRMARFERGLVFRETVTDWQPGKTLAFAIAAEQAPAEALDEHVRVGGRYFDVLDGRYTLVPVDAGHTELHLSSRHRLTTTLNGYAGLWSQAVMWDLQRVILEVVAHRAEATGRKAG